MSTKDVEVMLRVRYSETDQMGTFYNSRALEWFECGRTELLRELAIPYSQMESHGAMLPLVEAHVSYLGRARYDDLLRVNTRASMLGKARVRFDIHIAHAESGKDVADGYTIHAVTGRVRQARKATTMARRCDQRATEFMNRLIAPTTAGRFGSRSSCPALGTAR